VSPTVLLATEKQRQRSQILNSPWILAVAGGLVALVPFVLIKTLFTTPTPKPTASPVVVGEKTPGKPTSVPTPGTPTVAVPTSSPQVLAAEQLTATPGQSIIRQGTLQTNQVMVYRLPGLQQNQMLSASMDGGLQITILAPNNQPIDFQAKKVAQWQGNIPLTGDYTIEVSVPDGLPVGNYKLIVTTPATPSFGGGNSTTTINPVPTVTVAPLVPTPSISPK
jgi:hypothetical protein